MRNLALRKSGFYSGEVNILRVDQVILPFKDEFEGYQKRLLQIQKEAQGALGMDQRVLARLFRHRPFVWLLMILPRAWLTPWERFQDPYFFLEKECKNHLNRVQETMLNLLAVIQTLSKQKEQMQADLSRARQDKWGALEIRRWLYQQSNDFRVDSRLEYLFQTEIENLGDQAYQERRQLYLERMADLAKTAQVNFEALKPVIVASCRVFDVSHLQYLGVALLRPPTTALAQTAYSLTELNEASLKASGIFQTGLKEYFDIIAGACEAFNEVSKRLVAGPETQRILEEGRQKLISRLEIQEENKDETT